MNELEKEFVPYQESLELKELDFDEPLHFGYYKDEIAYWNNPNNHNQSNVKVSAPTFSQAFRWFRKKGYDVKIQKESDGLYFGFYWTGASWVIVGDGTYEEAELECLRKLIEIVKNTSTAN